MAKKILLAIIVASTLFSCDLLSSLFEEDVFADMILNIGNEWSSDFDYPDQYIFGGIQYPIHAANADSGSEINWFVNGELKDWGTELFFFQEDSPGRYEITLEVTNSDGDTQTDIETFIIPEGCVIETINTTILSNGSYVKTIAVKEDIIAILTSEGQLHNTLDGGHHWINTSNYHLINSIQDVSLLKSGGETYYFVVDGTGKILRSQGRQGITYEELSFSQSTRVNNLQVVDSTLFAFNSTNIYYSNDFGNTFSEIVDNGSNSFDNISGIGASGNQTLLIRQKKSYTNPSESEANILFSDSNFQNWAERTDRFPNNLIDYSRINFVGGAAVFAINQSINGLQCNTVISTNLGQSFETIPLPADTYETGKGFYFKEKADKKTYAYVTNISYHIGNSPHEMIEIQQTSAIHDFTDTQPSKSYNHIDGGDEYIVLISNNQVIVLNSD